MKKKNLTIAAFIAVCSVAVSVFYAFEYKPGAELIGLLTPFYVEGVSETRERCGANNDGGYIIPLAAIKNTAAVMSYGIADDISFEIDVIKKHNLPVYAFDCGIEEAPEKNDRLYFYPECIASDAFIYKTQKSSMAISSYNNQLKKLNLENKKIYIKMDIEGAEYESFDGIPDISFDNIQGITIEVHSLQNREQRPKVIRLLNTFKKHFVLVHVHGNNNEKYFRCIGRKIPQVIELTYINSKYAGSKCVSKEKFPTPLDKPNKKDKRDLVLDYWM
jgi:hypothetical protein